MEMRSIPADCIQSLLRVDLSLMTLYLALWADGVDRVLGSGHSRSYSKTPEVARLPVGNMSGLGLMEGKDERLHVWLILL